MLITVRPARHKYKQACITLSLVDERDALEELDAVVLRLGEAERRVEAERSSRDAAMRAALAAGASFGHLAERTDLTPARVGQILGHPHGRVGRPRLASREVVEVVEAVHL